MATKTIQVMGMIEAANRTKDGSLVAIAEALAKHTPIVEDMTFIESNGTNSHSYSKRASEPAGSWSVENEGNDYEVSTTIPAEEPISLLESWSKIDHRILRKYRDQAAFRQKEDLAFVAGMGKTVESAVWYGTGTKMPVGFSLRYNALALSNVYSAGGSANLESAWIVQWAPDKVSGIYPPGGKIGIQMEDDGKVTVYKDSKPYKAWQTHFMWDIGIIVQDDKNIARVANIDTTEAFSTNHLDNILIQALNHMPERGRDAFIYVGESVLNQFDINAKDKTNVNYGTANVWGEDTTTFKHKPVRLSDMLVAESAVS